MTETQLHESVVKRNKYNARKVMVDGKTFHSKREALRYLDLKSREQTGEIRRLELQPVFPIVIDGKPVLIRSEGYPNGRRAKYTADFSYYENNRNVIEEVKGGRGRKGTDTEASRLRRAVVEAIYNVRVELV